MSFQIINAKKVSLKDEDTRMLAEIETHPRILEWDTDIYVKDRDIVRLLFKRFFERLSNDKNQIFLVGKSDNKIIGFVGIRRKNKHMRHVGDIGVTVHPDYWNKGFGTSLLKAGIEEAKKEKFLKLEAETLAKNKAMIRIAEKTGFKLEGIRKMRIKMNEKFEDEALLGIILT